MADPERKQALGTCDNCENVFSVWVLEDGELQAVSQINACACDEPQLRVLDDIFGEE